MQVVLRNSFVDGPVRISFQGGNVSLDDFMQICDDNPGLRLERNLRGELFIVPGSGRTIRPNSELSRQLSDWVLVDGRGLAFDSSKQFILPSGAVYSPDAAWVEVSRWNALSKEQQGRFPALCPGFVIELMCSGESLSNAQLKMQEWIANGAQLGWLIEPNTRTVYIYRPAQSVIVHCDAGRVEGDQPVNGFVLDLNRIWL